ncbi:MAG TPA: type II toxin-antitoxin system VapC family toxin [Candidatus Limnocylindrales bacterium]
MLPDVNVYVHAFREAAPDHVRYREWLRAALAGDEPVGISELVLSGFVRVVTHPRVFDPPDSVDAALAFADAVRVQPASMPVAAAERHWSIFEDLCRAAGVKGNLVPDAYLAALAIESGAEFITADRDFARFPGLRWRHPLAKR